MERIVIALAALAATAAIVAAAHTVFSMAPKPVADASMPVVSTSSAADGAATIGLDASAQSGDAR